MLYTEGLEGEGCVRSIDRGGGNEHGTTLATYAAMNVPAG